MSAGLDSGLAISTIVIFFCLQFPKDGTIGLNSIQTWWGNTVSANTADAAGVTFYSIPAEGFGPTSW